MILGDSITDNWLKFDRQFFIDNNIAGRGVSGQVTSQMLVRFRDDVLALRPRYLVILAGTKYRWRPGMAPAEDIKALNAMIKSYAVGHGFKYVSIEEIPHRTRKSRDPRW